MSALGGVVERVQRAWNHPRADQVRLVGLALALLGAGALFLRHLHGFYPIGQWLFWRYAKAWALSLYWIAGCLSAGFAIVQRFGPRMALRERLLFGMATGVFVFQTAIFVVGVAGLFHPVVAALLPGLHFAAGAVPLYRAGQRAWVHLRHRRPLARPSLLTLALVAWGVVCVAIIYVGILHPKNASFDSTWYHLGIPQQYAADHAIRRTPEGWFVSALPQLAALLYTWPFILPGMNLFDRVTTAAHMEMVLFLATLAAIPLLVRWLVPKVHSAAASWTAMFLFPAIFIYDANLSSANDHVAAFWAVPIALALRRAWAHIEVRACALLSLCMAGALLTKYQAASLLVLPALALTARAAWLAVRRRDPRVLAGLGVALGLGLLFTTTHWLKNWVWYGDPLYPALYKHFTPHPWNPDAEAYMSINWDRLVKRPQGTTYEKLRETFIAGFHFSFTTHARSQMHADWPMFGSLFTLSLVWLPFLRGTKRIWALFLAAQIGVFAWYYMTHVERYLQALVPWMAAIVAATLVLVWRRGWIARVPLMAVVAVQAVWGSDAAFFPTHVMIGDSALRASASLIATGYKKDYKGRLRFAEPMQSIGEKLPRNAVVLLHEHNPRLGLRRVVTDSIGFQGLLSYGRFDSARALYDQLRAIGVTHFVWRNRTSRNSDSIAGDLRFFELAAVLSHGEGTHGNMAVSRLPDAAPTTELPQEVVYLGCGKTYGRGTHQLPKMVVQRGEKKRVAPARALGDHEAEVQAAVDAAGYVVFDAGCKKPAPGLGAFVNVAARDSEQLWVRKR